MSRAWLFSWLLLMGFACSQTARAQQAVEATDDEIPRRADYVVETPGEDEASTDSGAATKSAKPPAAPASRIPTDECDEQECDCQGAPADPDDPCGTELIKERHPDGSVKIEREVTQDVEGNYVNHGSWKMWDEAGRLLAQGEYKTGNRHGTWLRWYRRPSEVEMFSKSPYQEFTFPLISQATFDNGRLQGAWTIYDAKMRKISQWQFAGGDRHGSSTWWFANGKKMREINYKRGQIDGTYQEWTGDAKLQTNDQFQAGRKLEKKVTHHSETQKKSEGIYLLAQLEVQTPDDWWNCKPHSVVKKGNDEKHGPWTSWHANGERQLEGAYEHNKPVGLFTWWHANGQKALEGRYTLGKQEGAWTWWYATGQKAIRGQYNQGSPAGRWTWWTQEGKVAQSADLSQSEGVVIETPRTLDHNAPLPRLSTPPRKAVKR